MQLIVEWGQQAGGVDIGRNNLRKHRTITLRRLLSSMASENAVDGDPEWVETWKANASAFDRVKSVTMALTEPRPASWIADEAAVAPNTGRDHLDRLMDLDVVTANVLDLIDERTEPIDSWSDIDGAETGAADAAIWVRVTDDDPAGSPTWSEWQRLDVGEYKARALQAQVRMTSTDPAMSPLVKEAAVRINTL